MQADRRSMHGRREREREWERERDQEVRHGGEVEDQHLGRAAMRLPRLSLSPQPVVDLQRERHRRALLLASMPLSDEDDSETYVSDDMQPGPMESSDKGMNETVLFQEKAEEVDCSEDLLRLTANLLSSSDLCDVILACGDASFDCHQLILSAWSEPLRRMMAPDMLEGRTRKITIPDTSAAALELFLEFMYTGKCTLDADNVLHLFYLAHKYDVQALEKECEAFMPRIVNPSSVGSVLQMARQFSMRELEARCWNLLVQDFAQVVQAEEFAELPVDVLQTLLAADDLAVDSERVVFEAVLTWVAADLNKRQVLLTALLEGVRMCSMSHEDLADLHLNPVAALAPDLRQMQLDALITVCSSPLQRRLPQLPRLMVTNSPLLDRVFAPCGGPEPYRCRMPGTFRIVAAGGAAQGTRRFPGGRGAVIAGTFRLAEGDRLKIICGESSRHSSGSATSGAGAAVVMLKRGSRWPQGKLSDVGDSACRGNGWVPLLVAGGGGGASLEGPGVDACIEEQGLSGWGPIHGAGGCMGGDGGRLGGAACYPSGNACEQLEHHHMHAAPRSSSNYMASRSFHGLHGATDAGHPQVGGGGRAGMHRAGGGGGYSGGGPGHSGGGGGGSYLHADAEDCWKAVRNAGPCFVTILLLRSADSQKLATTDL